MNRLVRLYALPTIARTLLVLLTVSNALAKDEPFEAAGMVQLRNIKGRIDHLAVNASARQLWVAAHDNNTVEVIDIDRGKVLTSIKGLRQPQGVCCVPDSDHMLVACGGDGALLAFDTKFAQVAKLAGLPDADNVRYDPHAKRVYLGYGRGALAVIDPENLNKLADIKLPAHPESFQLETNGPRIFINIPEKQQICVVDRVKQKITATWPVKESLANYPMALDETNHRLFIVCRRPARILVLDTGSGKTIATLPCCGDADDVFYDFRARRIFASGGEGFISCFEQTDADHYEIMPQVKTANGARTSTFDPQSRRLFVAMPKHGGVEAQILVLKLRA